MPRLGCARLADWLCATADLGLVFLFFIRGSNEEIPDESGRKTLQLVFPFFVDHPNEEIPDDRRSTAAHNLSGCGSPTPKIYIKSTSRLQIE
ncbi:hypothetical protein CCANI_13325 [Corynebacterium canis]|nr:hypothetical protein CCANI_13325 [Corynebacterium canis]